MKSNLNLPIEQLTKEYLANIKVICFDGDGVTKKKGTEFIFESGQLVLESYPPQIDFLDKLKLLRQKFHVTISSGRSMSYLMNSYGEATDSLQAEIGMYLQINDVRFMNYDLRIEQKDKIEKIRKELGRLSDANIRGFEPKEYLITLHCKQAVPEVEEIVKTYDPEGELYCWWNEEAYDIGLRGINKATGLQKLVDRLELEMDQVMTVGNGINDENMTAAAGLDISTDPKHLSADFVATGEELGGEVVVDKILSLVEKNA